MATQQIWDEAAHRKLKDALLRHNFMACLVGTRACGQAREVKPPEDGRPAAVFCCAVNQEVPQRQSLFCTDVH